MEQFKCGVSISGTGRSLPEKRLTNEDLQKIVDTSDQWIVSRTGIKERRIISDGESSSILAVKAANEALRQAGVKPEELDMIIVATATPDMLFPSTACLVQHSLGAEQAIAFDLEAACSGFIYATAVGSQFITGKICRRVLIIGVDVLSRYIDWSDRTTCILFGDGAGAALLQPADPGRGLLSFVLKADGKGIDLLKMPGFASFLPSKEFLAEKKHTIRMRGNEVFKFAVKAMADGALECIKEAGLEVDDIDLLIPHQANIRIIESVRNRLRLPIDKVFSNLEKYGNTSAASIPIALSEAVEGGYIQEGANVVLTAFGAGFTWAACVFRW